MFGGQGHGEVGGVAGGPAVDSAGAGDAYGLFGVWKRQPARGGDGDRLDGAGLFACVADLAASVAGWDVRPRQGFELGVQGGLVAR